jgi:hypothetical protein
LLVSIAIDRRDRDHRPGMMQSTHYSSYTAPASHHNTYNSKVKQLNLTFAAVGENKESFT